MTRPLQNGCPFSSTYIIYHFAGAGKMVPALFKWILQIVFDIFL